LPVLLVLTGETLRFLDGFSGSEKAALAEGPGGFPGSPRAVCASGSAAYVAGEDREGASFLARLAGLGRAGRAVTLPLPSTTRVRALSVLGDWPALTAATDRGSDNLFIYSPTLAAASDNSPGYTNVRLLRAVPLHLDADSFADVAVIRTSADAGYRLDVFSNRLGELTAELKAAEGNLEHAVLGREENDVIRALRRVELLKAAVSPGTAPEADEKRLRSRFQAESRRRNLRTRGAVTTAALSLVAGIVLLLVLRRRRRAVPPGQQIENKQLPVRVALAADLVALDHNFLSKGNHQAAFERFVEVRDRHGLTLDRDLCRLTDAPTPGPLAPDPLPGIYSRAISRLIDSTPTVPVYELICKACRSAAGDRPLEELELTREGLRRMEHEPGFRLICIRSIEHPDIYRRLRWFSNPVLRGALEHFVVDHFRYADTWAAIVLDYLVNTQWNRRLLVRFLSDSSCSIDFRRQDGHLVSQTVDLAALLRPGIELPTYDSATAVPNEKLWLKNADYISVLEETRARLEGPTRQTGVSAPGVSLT
jgi:hypothetical protein